MISNLGETLAQNERAVALFGDQTAFTGASRSMVYRWFTDPAELRIYPTEDHAYHSREFVAGLRARVAARSHDSKLVELVELLSKGSTEFSELWARHEVHVRTSDRKRIAHPMIGPLELDCQTLISETDGQVLLVYTATPGTHDYDQLRLLSVTPMAPCG